MASEVAMIDGPLPSTASTCGAEDPSGNLFPLQVDADGNLLIAGDITASNASVAPTGGPVPAQANYVAGQNSGTLVGIKVGSDGTVAVSTASLPLPTGAATEATLSALNAKVTAVNTGAVTISTALPAGANAIGSVSVSNFPSTQPVSGTVAATQSGTWTNTVTQATGTNLHTVIDSGTITTVSSVTAIANALPTGANVIGAVTQSGAWTMQPGNTANTTAWLVNNQVIGQSGSTNALSSLASTALETSHVIKASAGRLYQLTGVNTKASAQYIQVFNSTTVPADTTVPVLLAYVPAGSNFSFDFGSIGRYFSTGISVSNSSTAATKTIGSADCWFNAEYL